MVLDIILINTGGKSGAYKAKLQMAMRVQLTLVQTTQFNLIIDKFTASL